MVRTGCALLFLSICGIEDLRKKEISWILILGCTEYLDSFRDAGAGTQLGQCIGGAAVGVLLTGVAFLTREAIGYGDGAVTAIAGMMLGLSRIVEILLIALGAAAVVSAVLLMLKKAGRKKELPFIPFLACAGWFCVMMETGTVKGKKAEKGSFTVEISLIMSLLIPLLMCLIYLGFYMHDRAFLEGAALEAACTASLYAGEEMQEDYTESREQALLKERLFGVYNITGNVELGEETVKFRTAGISDSWNDCKVLEKTSLPIQAGSGSEF